MYDHFRQTLCNVTFPTLPACAINIYNLNSGCEVEVVRTYSRVQWDSYAGDSNHLLLCLKSYKPVKQDNQESKQKCDPMIVRKLSYCLQKIRHLYLYLLEPRTERIDQTSSKNCLGGSMFYSQNFDFSSACSVQFYPDKM